jgi:MFS family permease
MDVSLNLVAVVLAALSTMVVGSIWYGKIGFGDLWQELAKVKPDPNFGGSKAAMLYGGAFLASLVTAFVLAYFTEVTYVTMGGTFLSNALWVGLLAWLGFTAARMYMHDSFEGRRKKLTLLNGAHELATVMVMALIIGLLG